MGRCEGTFASAGEGTKVPDPMRRLLTLLAALLLAFPGAAFAQGAGDDQYQDPFGDEPVQSDGGSDSDSAPADEPPATGGGSAGTASGSGSEAGSSDSGAAPSTGTATPATPAAPAEDAQATGQLPRTGADPLLLLGLGVACVLTGVGLRLRTIDPDAY